MSLADGAVVHGDVILSNTDIAVHQDAGSRVEGMYCALLARQVAKTNYTVQPRSET